MTLGDIGKSVRSLYLFQGDGELDEKIYSTAAEAMKQLRPNDYLQVPFDPSGYELCEFVQHIAALIEERHPSPPLRTLGTHITESRQTVMSFVRVIDIR